MQVKIIAKTLQELKLQKYGRKDCTIYITYKCAKEIRKIPIWEYDDLMEDLKCRNIELKDLEKQKKENKNVFLGNTKVFRRT